ncbi:hypothetical protein [uncultured Parabacteroides sp.]|uniref:hypothetical protein n=1 Tax=uncultured Parabacteroides sp. TaxID=512312 RepID=UPI002585BE01|nr:hypothetical protein [uncultured Parabacteroides sp.]
MKLLLSFLFFFLSFGCLFIVCNADKWEPGNVFFWACVFGVSVIVTEKQLKKYEKSDSEKTP